LPRALLHKPGKPVHLPLSFAPRYSSSTVSSGNLTESIQVLNDFASVHEEGLEPPRLAALEPKSCWDAARRSETPFGSASWARLATSRRGWGRFGDDWRGAHACVDVRACAVLRFGLWRPK
jgi:hypothetical protein